MEKSNNSNLTYGRGYVYKIQYHIVWCTKYRHKLLVNGIERFLRNDLLTTANKLKINILEMEIMPDHIHLLVDCSPQMYIPTMIKNFKGNSASRLFMVYPELKEKLWGGHLWNPSYFIATVSDNTSKQITEYIQKQKTKL